MTRFLPPPLKKLFQAREPPTPLLPIVKKPCGPYNGLAAYLGDFAAYDHDASPKPDVPITLQGTIKREALKKRKRELKLAAEQENIAKKLKTWDPHNNPKATGDAYKTLFAARLSHETSEQKLQREFEKYGPVKSIRMGKHRGYAFVEFERERDMRAAYKEADGQKIDGKRVLVDVERGRTVRDWKPRRFGGGKGGTRRGGDDVNVKYSGREPPRRSTSDRGDRGDYRGDRRGGDRRDSYRDRGGRYGGGGGRDRRRDSYNDRGDRRYGGGDRGDYRGDRRGGDRRGSGYHRRDGSRERRRRDR